MSFNSAHWFARPKLIQLALQTKRPNPRQPTIFIQNSKWINYQRVSNPSVGEFSLGFVPITKRGLKKLARSLGRAESLGIHASLSFFWESHGTVIIVMERCRWVRCAIVRLAIPSVSCYVAEASCFGRRAEDRRSTNISTIGVMVTIKNVFDSLVMPEKYSWNGITEYSTERR